MNEKLFIRISRKHIAFAVFDPANTAQPVSYQPYQAKAGISIAANMREAFRDMPLLGENYQRVTVMVDTPALMVPVSLFDESEKDTLFRHAFPSSTQDTVLFSVLPDLSCVALYSVNRDLKMVLDSHYPQAIYHCAAAPVWRHLHSRSFMGVRSKLYGYFHSQRLDIFSFQQNRFKFCNSFDTQRRADAIYFLLYVWRQLNLSQEHDELHLAGEIPEGRQLLDELHQYLRRAYIINPSADYNRSPVTQIEGLPYDVMTLIVKGR